MNQINRFLRDKSKQLFSRILRQSIPLNTQVVVVSFPRSGHHAMVGFLNKISDFADNYCEFYSCTRHNGQPISCPNKGKSSELKNYSCAAGNQFLKSHDFNLSLPFQSNVKYIVQYRHPFLSIQSWYEMESKKKTDLPAWPNFFEEKLLFWRKFADKWIIKHGNKENVILVPYDSLSNSRFIADIAAFSGANLKSNASEIQLNFKSMRKIPKEQFLKEQEQMILPILKEVGIPPLFQ